MDAIFTEKRNGLTIKIYQDDSPESPREWDNLGTIEWRRADEVSV
jgi:hypothetical protein